MAELETRRTMASSSDGRRVSLPMPGFARFYRAINRRDPFPWQQRLAENIAQSDQWPIEIGVPTGLGKTACLEIAIWWLASQAHLPPVERTAPTRIWWVVNRRLLVDSTAEHAISIAKVLKEPAKADLAHDDHATIVAVAGRLRSLAADSDAIPLDVIRLRGGVASRTPKDPSQPTVILSTLPMYGSRLLFRGYGSSQRKRAVDAAMAGTDSLVLLDEAHLAQHLIALVQALGECYPNSTSILNPVRTRPCVVALTATGRASEEARFTLGTADQEHPIVSARLRAVKRLELRMATGDLGKAIAESAHELITSMEEPATVLIFVNTPKTARDVYNRIEKKLRKSSAEVLLLTGRTREREADRLRKRILDPVQGMAATRHVESQRSNHLVVVATQTLEVGADIDAEYLVTEACGARALIQRLGRLNRLGRFNHARAIYVHTPPKKRRSKRNKEDSEYWPVYGNEPADVLRALERAASSSNERAINMSPAQITGVLGAPTDSLGRAPEILPGILWEWVKTTEPPEGEAPVEPYFSGIAGERYNVSLLWRIHVPKAGERLWPRPTDHEAVDVPIREARNVFETKEVMLHRLEPDRITVEAITAGDLRSGDQIILPSDCGLLDQFGWNPNHAGSVTDVSLRRHGLPLDAEAIKRLCGLTLTGEIKDALNENHEDVDLQEQADAIARILKAVQSATPLSDWESGEWESFCASLKPLVVSPRKEVPRLRVRNPDTAMLNSEFDETSVTLDGAAVDLRKHGLAVAAKARAIADRIGMPAQLADVIEKAGEFHDIGKVDRRFQRWLDPQEQHSVPLAKSGESRYRWEELRAAAGWPRGGRHETLSARLVCAWLEKSSVWSDPTHRDLLIHLVVSHHGKGRPFTKPVNDPTADSVSATIEGIRITVPASLEVADWDQPSRFQKLNDCFGPWGLALLEAIVIRSDHSISKGT